MIYDPQPYEEPPLPVDSKDEAYSLACEELDRLRAKLYAQLEDVAQGVARKNAEIAQLKALMERAADVLCAYASNESAFVQELRRAAK
jgi:hypothetical protein